MLFFFVVDSGVLYLVKLLALYFSHDKFLLKCLRKNRDSNYKPHEMTLVPSTGATLHRRGYFTHKKKNFDGV